MKRTRFILLLVALCAMLCSASCSNSRRSDHPEPSQAAKWIRIETHDLKKPHYYYVLTVDTSGACASWREVPDWAVQNLFTGQLAQRKLLAVRQSLSTLLRAFPNASYGDPNIDSGTRIVIKVSTSKETRSVTFYNTKPKPITQIESHANIAIEIHKKRMVEEMIDKGIIKLPPTRKED